MVLFIWQTSKAMEGTEIKLTTKYRDSNRGHALHCSMTQLSRPSICWPSCNHSSPLWLYALSACIGDVKMANGHCQGEQLNATLQHSIDLGNCGSSSTTRADYPTYSPRGEQECLQRNTQELGINLRTDALPSIVESQESRN